MFTASSIVVRWLLCTFIVFATYNVTGYSYYHWLVVGPAGDWALKTLIGWLLLVVFAVFTMTIWRSMGPPGTKCITTKATMVMPMNVGMMSSARRRK